MKTTETPSKDQTWNHHPDLPLEQVPYWQWPPKPLLVLRWLFENFLQFSDRALYMVYAIALALWLMPFMPAEAVLAWDWTLLVLVRNFVAVFLVVGG